MELSWTPKAETLDRILRTLREVNNPALVQQVHAAVAEMSADAEWPLYLSYILSVCAHEQTAALTFAGVLLKQYVRAHWRPSSPGSTSTSTSGNTPMLDAAVKKAVLASLASPVPEVRRSGANVAATIVERTGFAGWPELLPLLSGSLTTAPAYVVDGVLYALTLIFEDQHRALDDPAAGAPLRYLAPQLIAVVAGNPAGAGANDALPCTNGTNGSGSSSCREQAQVYALECLRCVLPAFGPSLQQHSGALLRALTAAAQAAPGASERVRAGACDGLCLLTLHAPGVVAPVFDDLARFFLGALAPGAPDGVCLAACRFWRAACHSDAFRPRVETVLAQLLPLLLARMVFTPAEIAAIHADEQSNLLASNCGTRQSGGGGSGGNSSDYNDDCIDDDDGGEDDEEDDFAEDGISDESDSNSVRRSAAATLDDTACTFGDAILPLVIPHIEARMHAAGDAAQWPVLEAAILAIGAIGHGCRGGLAPYMPRVLPYLIDAMGSAEPSIRGTAAWTGARYSELMVAEFERAPSAAAAQTTLLCRYVQRALALLQDPIDKVFSYACSALADLIDTARERFAPFAAALLDTVARIYPARGASWLLCDVVAALADALGPALAAPAYTRVLMPLLMQRWAAVRDDDPALSALLSCLRCVACALRESFQPYAEAVFHKSLHFIGVCTQLCQQRMLSSNSGENDDGNDGNDGDKRNKRSSDDNDNDDDGMMGPVQRFGDDADILVTALNMIGEMCACFREAMDTLVAPSALVPLLGDVVALPAPDIRRAALGLVGDLAAACPACLRGALPAIAAVLDRNLAPVFPSVATNAAWALGEIALRDPAPLAPVLPSALPKLLALLCAPAPPAEPGLPYNAAIALGRLALVRPADVAPRAAALNVFPVWCKVLSELQEGPEQRDAAAGLCNVCATCPQQVAPMFSYALLVFASCSLVPVCCFFCLLPVACSCCPFALHKTLICS